MPAACRSLAGGKPGAASVAGEARDDRNRETGQAPEVAAPVAPLTTRAAIVNQLNSEYLRSISGSWYATAAVAFTPATTRAAIVNQLNSEYLRQIARDWLVATPDVNRNQMNSEYLREISRDW